MWRRASEGLPDVGVMIDISPDPGKDGVTERFEYDGGDWAPTSGWISRNWWWRPADCDRPASTEKVSPPPAPESALVVGIVKSGEKMSAYHLWNRVGTSWQANTFIDLVKMQVGMMIPDGENSDGSQKYRRTSIPEALGSARAIMEGILVDVEARGWVAKLPTIDELREGEPEQAGFTSPRHFRDKPDGI